MNTPEPEEYDDIREIQEKVQNGTSIRRCAKEYGISESTLRGRLNKGCQNTPHSTSKSTAIISQARRGNCLFYKA
jgi:DNA invertase Pin-like site-specific DNA recombinase